MSTSQREQIAERMQDLDYRAAFVDQYVRRFLPAQIRAMREERGWSQEQLGERCGGKSQEWISRLESPSYGRYSTQTLIDLAAGFDVALMVRFVSFGTFLDWYSSRTSHAGVPGFADDAGVLRVQEEMTAHLRLVAAADPDSTGTLSSAPPSYTTSQGETIAA